jgi:hypothetical protein
MNQIKCPDSEVLQRSRAKKLKSTFFVLVAPLTEDDYSQADDHSDFSASHIKKSGLNNNLRIEENPVSRSKFQNDQSRSKKLNRCLEDVPLQLNLPLGSDGQGSHDSHNDSGYSTRLGFSAGPSPSLSGN